MHKVYLKSVRSLEDKFDKEKADWIEENVATIRFDNIPFEEAARYNKKQVVILTVSEYEALTEGKDWLMPEEIKQRFKTLMAAMMDLLSDEVKGGDSIDEEINRHIEDLINS
jgi:hypothetical protein